MISQKKIQFMDEKVLMISLKCKFISEYLYFIIVKECMGKPKPKKYQEEDDDIGIDDDSESYEKPKRKIRKAAKKPTPQKNKEETPKK